MLCLLLSTLENLIGREKSNSASCSLACVNLWIFDFILAIKIWIRHIVTMSYSMGDISLTPCSVKNHLLYRLLQLKFHFAFIQAWNASSYPTRASKTFCLLSVPTCWTTISDGRSGSKYRVSAYNRKIGTRRPKVIYLISPNFPTCPWDP